MYMKNGYEISFTEEVLQRHFKAFVFNLWNPFFNWNPMWQPYSERREKCGCFGQKEDGRLEPACSASGLLQRRAHPSYLFFFFLTEM